MRNLKLTIEYDGSLYHGWQVQPGLVTIQGVLQDHLSQILEQPTFIFGAGRTDAGVHAKGQVAHFHTSKTFPTEIIKRALNAHLPRDIVIKEVEEVHPSFHAQFDAKSKEYRYYLFNQSLRSPFYRHYALLMPLSLDFEKMQEALEYIRGTHDFFPLSVASYDKENTIRTITRAELIAEGDLWVFILEGNGFLHKMVRRIVGTILEVGKHKISGSKIQEILQSRDKRLGGCSVPPNGLFLMSVKY